MTRIAVALNGGLGNQLFQYATARRLAHRNRAKLTLLLGDRYAPGTQRSFGLDRFRIAARPASPNRLPEWLPRSLRPMPLPVIQERFIFAPTEIEPVLRANPQAGAERRLLFEPRVLEQRGSCELRGFWQDERYFAGCAALLRQELSLRDPLDPRSAATLADIRAGPSVFLHVRRGDYAAGPVAGLYGCPGPDWYGRALDLLRARAGSPLRVFAFSDEPDWVRAQGIGGPDVRIVDWNGDRPERDLALMRHCDHAVIANSSFSWWGAWLGDKPGRTVVAPALWYIARPEYQEIVPERWLRLD